METLYICASIAAENQGGIYRYTLSEKGKFNTEGYYPCDLPMYAIKDEGTLYIVLKKSFDDRGGYFSLSEDLTKASLISESGGLVPCHIAEREGNVYVVNYLSGNIVKNGIKTVSREGCGVNKRRQDRSHTHFINFAPDGNLLVCDLGTDTLATYDRDLNLISEAVVPSGYGIRHFIFSKDKTTLYAVNELEPSVSVFSYACGKAELKTTVLLDIEKNNATAAAIRLSADEKYLYVSVRGENVIFTLDVKTLGTVQKVSCGGDSPRDFDLIGNFLICANENSNNVVAFKINEGKIGKKTDEISLPVPLCVVKA